MKTLSNWLVLSFLVICAVLAATGLALRYWFNPEDYRAEIQHWLRERTGIELDWRSPMRWELSPWLTVELDEVTATPVTQPQQPLLQARRLSIAVQPWPLLQGEIRLRSVETDGLNLSLRHDEDGRGNWEIRPVSSVASSTATESAHDSAGFMPFRWVLDVAGLSVQNGQASYEDARTGARLFFEQLDLRTNRIKEGALIPFTLRGHVQGMPLPWQASGEMVAGLRFDRAAQHYQLEGMQVRGVLNGEFLPSASVTFEARGDVAANLAAQQIDWTHLRVNANQLNALGEFHWNAAQGQWHSGLSIAPFDAQAFFSSIGRPLPESLAEKAFRHVAGAAKLTGDMRSVRIDELQLQLDESRVQGQLMWQAGEEHQAPQISGRLSAALLDIDAWLTPSRNSSSPTSTPSETAADSAISAVLMGFGDSPLPAAPTVPAWDAESYWPLAKLQRVVLDMKVDAARLRWQGWPLEELRMQARVEDGQLSLNEVRARLLSGQLTANLQLDTRPTLARWQWAMQLDQVPLARLLRAQPGLNLPVLTGLLQLQTTLQGEGNNAQQLVNSLSGSGNLLVENGSLPGVNLEQPLCRAIAAYRQQIPTQVRQFKETPLRELRSSFRIENGLMRSSDVQARLPGILLHGEGATDLRTLGVDYRLRVRVAEGWQMPDPACQLDARVSAMLWPLRCRGPLALGARTCRADQ